MAKRSLFKSIVNQKNSIFMKILTPTIAVMLLQVVLISLTLFLNGTIDSLKSAAVDVLYRNAENRSITLENMMVHSWSNIDALETDMSDIFSKYILGKALSPEEVFGNPSHEKELLSRTSDALIYTMRTNSTTGAFVFFVGEQSLSSDVSTLNGLYYRDFNPLTNSADYSDIQLEKGPAGIAQKTGISLSSLWSERYTVSKENASTWEALFAPYQTAIENPGLATRDLALWSDAHYLDPASKNDSNACVTYTRPLFFEGRLVGVIGVEMQLEQLKKYFPSSDIGEMGGYALLHYSPDDAGSSELICSVNAVTGSYIKRLADSGATLTLKQDEDNIYQVVSKSFEPTTIAVQPIKLYNSHAPFSDRQWALGAVQPDSVLSENAVNVRRGIISSSVISLVFGFVFMLMTIRMATKPLLSIASQIESGNADDLVVVKNSRTYEVKLLCDTINEMKRKRKDVEVALREEGERYLLALESAIDIFIEYTLADDRLRVYFFTEESRQLTSRVVDGFRENWAITRICHPSDAKGFMAVLCGERSEPCEMRIRTEIFPHITNVPSDDGYYWFSFAAIQIQSADGALEKTIGSAKQITQEKLEEFARIEASRRDLTTGAYNWEYGRLVITGQADEVAGKVEHECVLAIVIGNFESIEAYYGRAFGAAILREISSRIQTGSPAVYHLIRWGNAEFVAFCAGSSIEGFTENLRQIYGGIYTGENTEISLAINLGVCTNSGDTSEEALARAFSAARLCGSTGVNVMRADGREDIAGESLPSQTGSYPDMGIDVSRESIVGFTLSLFEQASDIKSVMKLLLRLLGELFSLDRIIVCEYDEDFGSNQVAYQWVSEGTPEYTEDMERIQHADFVEFVSYLTERGLMVYDSASSRGFSKGMRQLLCMREDATFAALCCEMYENGRHAGRAIFVSLDETYKMSESIAFSVYEMAKIIFTRLNLERSNSASRAKSEFLSKMSHEIRTPMNAIIGLTRMAKEAGQDSEQVRNSLDKIDVSAKHLLSLINDILDMSRIESGKLTVEKRAFSLLDVITDLDTLMRPQFEEKGITFTIDQAIVHADVEGDEQKLRQIIINLLGNACKFTLAGGRVDFLVSQQVEENNLCKCLFSVKDNGVGISKEDQFKIFNAFEQSASSNIEAGHPRGTGLGLAISNSFIAAMGSRIELRSEKGRGSEFYFTLNFKQRESASSSMGGEGEKQPAAERFKGKRALLVDDNDINLEIAAYLIENIGFVCDIARDGKEAVEKFLASEPGYYSIIFMDISMPVMDGFTATREIRRRVERSDSRHIPIIAMTANAFSEDAKKSIDAGMNAHVAKPIDIDFLYATLNALFSPNHSDDGGRRSVVEN